MTSLILNLDRATIDYFIASSGIVVHIHICLLTSTINVLHYRYIEVVEERNSYPPEHELSMKYGTKLTPYLIACDTSYIQGSIISKHVEVS